MSAFAVFSVTPTALNFGNVTVGSSSGVMTVTFTNNNTADSVLFDSISASGSFSITNNCPMIINDFSLPAGTSCTVDVVFSPQSLGTSSGQLTFAGTDGNLVLNTSVALSGSGQSVQSGNLSLTPSMLDFGSVPVGSSSNSTAVTLTNVGNASVSISAITSSASFTQSNDCPAVLDANSNCIIMVGTTPTSAGALSGTLTVTGTDPQGQIRESIPLSAVGTTSDLAVSDTQLSFAELGVNASSDPLIITVTNQGNAPLPINSITTEGDFSQSNDCGTEIAAASSCDVEVIFSPQSTGTATGSLIIDSGSGVATIVLSGSAVATSNGSLAEILRPYTGGNPNVISTSEVIAEACPSGRISARMQEDCDAVVGAAIGGDSGTGTALFQITPEPATKANRSTRQGGEAQSRNLGSRITALRAGARGLSFKGLDLQIDGQNLPIELIANSYKNSSQRGGGASADNQLLASRLGVFITGDIATGSKDETDLESGFDFDTYGITIGVDYRLTNQFILGGAVGYIDTNAEFESNGGDLDTQGVSLSLYGTYYSEQNYFVDFSATFGSNSFDQKRQIIYQLAGLADVNQTLKADYDGDMTNLFVGSGYDFNQGLWTFGPRADLEYIKSDVDGFTEEISDPTAAGGGWATRVGATDQSWLTLNVGGRASYTHSTDWGVVIPYARLDWLHEFKDDSQIITAHFVSDPAGNVIQIETDDPDRDYLRLRFGTSAQFQNGVVGFIDYGTILAHSDWSSHTISAGLRMEF